MLTQVDWINLYIAGLLFYIKAMLCQNSQIQTVNIKLQLLLPLLNSLNNHSCVCHFYVTNASIFLIAQMLISNLDLFCSRSLGQTNLLFC